MRDLQFLTDALLLHLAQKPLLILCIVFLLIVALTVILVGRQLRHNHASAQTSPSPSEDDRCC